MKYIMLVLALFALSGCDSEPTIDAKYLAMNGCIYTGKSFVSTESIWIVNGRTGHFEDKTSRKYLYECSPGQRTVISEVKLVIEHD